MITGSRIMAVLAALTAVPVHAQAPEPPPRVLVADQLQVITELKGEERFMADAGPLGRPTLLGVLEHDTTVFLEVTLDATREYHIAVRCDTGCTNIDARILGPNYDLLAEDVLDNDAPRMEFTPAQSGPHLLAVQMTTCAERICYFGIVTLSRPSR